MTHVIKQLLTACAGLAGAASALAHEGHGLGGSHWHATDGAILIALVAAAGAAIWFGGRK